MNNLKLIDALEGHRDSLDVAEADLSWAVYGIAEVIDKVKSLKEKLEKQGVDGIHFDNLQTYLGMHHYLMQGRLDYIKDEAGSAQIAVDIAKGEAK
jgi:hypothetical protein